MLCPHPNKYLISLVISNIYTTYVIYIIVNALLPLVVLTTISVLHYDYLL